MAIVVIIDTVDPDIHRRILEIKKEAEDAGEIIVVSPQSALQVGTMAHLTMSIQNDHDDLIQRLKSFNNAFKSEKKPRRKGQRRNHGYSWNKKYR